jgi:beta-galactosidase/beta-glucuronidase
VPVSGHPRPQLVRPEWEDLCGRWGFAYDDADRGRAERWWAGERAFDREIVVPFPPESAASQVHDPGFHPVVWYRRTIAPRLADGRRLLLHFGAVDHRADVWVGGTYVGGHEGGHTPFSFDVTEAVGDAAETTIVVRAEDRPTDLTQPRGKQDWRPEPHGIWYHRTTGIWQPVWLERVPELHIAALVWTPDLAAGTVTMDLSLSRQPVSPVDVTVAMRLGDDVLARTSVRVAEQTARHTVHLPAAANGPDLDRLTWSPERPTLIDVDVRLTDDEERVVDAVASYVGLRSAGCADGRFLLNGVPYYLRLVLEQGYWPESHLAAPSADALRREVELIKALGFNGVRVHQKVEDPRFLYWCDRLGLLVWGEMANAYAFTPTAAERLTREWLEVVRRDRSHPCIVTWVPVNESWGVQHLALDPAQRHLVSALHHLTKALDPTRPVIGNDGWEHTDSDIWGVHDYGATSAGLAERYGTAEAVRHSLRAGRPGRRRVLLDEAVDRGQPVVLSEFGGLSLVPAAGENWFGYSTVGSAAELLDRFAELVGALLDSPALAGFCYTQLTDTEQETNGLLTAQREPKIDPEWVREVLTRPARAVPAEETDALRRHAVRAAGGDG